MQASEVKPSTNGVIRLSRRGRAKFQFDEGDGPFEVDVIEVYDQWIEVDWMLRETVNGEEGVLLPNKQNEYGQNRLNFVQVVVNDAYGKIGKAAPVLTRAEAEEFITMLREEVAKLRNFTLPKKDGDSSSQENSAEMRINFSQ